LHVAVPQSPCELIPAVDVLDNVLMYEVIVVEIRSGRGGTEQKRSTQFVGTAKSDACSCRNDRGSIVGSDPDVTGVYKQNVRRCLQVNTSGFHGARLDGLRREVVARGRKT
jgi:hypothetical protein